MTTCPVCNGGMKPLLNSFYCPKDCDRPQVVAQTVANGSVSLIGTVNSFPIWRVKGTGWFKKGNPENRMGYWVVNDRTDVECIRVLSSPGNWSVAWPVSDLSEEHILYVLGDLDQRLDLLVWAPKP